LVQFEIPDSEEFSHDNVDRPASPDYAPHAPAQPPVDEYPDSLGYSSASSFDRPASPDYRPTSPSYCPKDNSSVFSSSFSSDEDDASEGDMRPAAVKQDPETRAALEKLFPPNPRYAVVEQHFVESAPEELSCTHCFASYDTDLLQVVGQPDERYPPCACKYLLCLACVRANILSRPQPSCGPFNFRCIVCNSTRKISSLRQLSTHRVIKIGSKSTVLHGLVNLDPVRMGRLAELRQQTDKQVAEAEQFVRRMDTVCKTVAQLEVDTKRILDEADQLDKDIDKHDTHIAKLVERQKRRHARRTTIRNCVGDFIQLMIDYPKQVAKFPGTDYAKQVRAAAVQILQDFEQNRPVDQLEAARLPAVPANMAQTLLELDALEVEVTRIQTKTNTLCNEPVAN